MPRSYRTPSRRVKSDRLLGLYERGGAVVRVVRVADRDARGDDVEVARMIPVGEHHLAELFDGAAEWERFDVRKDEAVAANCPPAVPRAYLARSGAGWNLPHLAGIITAPTMRADGSLLTAPGYDRSTRLFFDPRGETFPPIPEHPTDVDVAAALATLRNLFAGCAFIGEVDKSVALAAVLTALVRGALPAAPMFAFTASTAGTGKSYIAQIVARIAAGHSVGGLAYGADDAENRKQLDSALIEGRSLIVLDNVDTDIRGARLAEILTEPAITIRPLGQTATKQVPCLATILATGNNLVIAADLTRRTLLCRLDRRAERPELHQYDSDPLADVTADRGRYVAAGLTLLRGFVARGRPHSTKPLGSFEAWSSLVRGALLWAGMADPAASMESARDGDPRRGELRAVLAQWSAAIGARAVTSREIIDVATKHPEFREALLAVAGAAGSVDTSKLGRFLRGIKGKIVDGMHVETGKMRDGVGRWELHGYRAADPDDSEPAPPTLQELAQ